MVEVPPRRSRPGRPRQRCTEEVCGLAPAFARHSPSPWREVGDSSTDTACSSRRGLWHRPLGAMGSIIARWELGGRLAGTWVPGAPSPHAVQLNWGCAVCCLCNLRQSNDPFWPPLPFCKMQEGVMEGVGGTLSCSRGSWHIGNALRGGWRGVTVPASMGSSGGGRLFLPGLGESSQMPPWRLPPCGSCSHHAPLSCLSGGHKHPRGYLRGRRLGPPHLTKHNNTGSSGFSALLDKHLLQIFSAHLPPQPRRSSTPPRASGPEGSGALLSVLPMGSGLCAGGGRGRGVVPSRGPST